MKGKVGRSFSQIHADLSQEGSDGTIIARHFACFVAFVLFRVVSWIVFF